ncbi:MAG TPA: hypothetical protein VFJ72_04310 [Rubrobacteraceae bacterium]|nr:hypothetical protein [Rubrobacteraceae bacterium]
MKDSEQRGNRDAPRVEENETRSEDRRGESAPRRVGDVRRDHEAERHRRESELGTSWTSVTFGWLTALGAGLILSGIVGGIVGAILGAMGVKGGTEGGVAALVGLLITLLLAFLIGGYVAGRMASRAGVKHGLLVPLLALVVTLLLAAIGTAIGYSFIDQLSGVTLPKIPGGVQNQIPQQNLATLLTVPGILALLFPFIGGAIGGAWGAKTGRNRPY